MSESKQLAVLELTWTFDDYVERRCLLSEVGQVRYDDGFAKRLARQHTAVAMEALVEVAKQSGDLGAKQKAAAALLDRGYGKPDQHVQQESETVIRVEWASPDRLSYRNRTIDVTPAVGAPPAAWKPEEKAAAQAMRELDALPRAGKK